MSVIRLLCTSLTLCSVIGCASSTVSLWSVDREEQGRYSFQEEHRWGSRSIAAVPAHPGPCDPSYPLRLCSNSEGQYVILWADGRCVRYQWSEPHGLVAHAMDVGGSVCGAAWSSDGSRLALVVCSKLGEEQARIPIALPESACPPEERCRSLCAVSWNKSGRLVLVSTSTSAATRRSAWPRSTRLVSLDEGAVIGQWAWSDSFFVGEQTLVARMGDQGVVQCEITVNGREVVVDSQVSLGVPFAPEDSIPQKSVFVYRAPMNSLLFDPKMARGHVILCDTTSGARRRLSQDMLLVTPICILGKP